MKILVIAENEDSVEGFIPKLRNKGFEANFLQLIKINMVSKHKLTLIKAVQENIPRYDAIFLQSRTNLAPFIEPLLDEVVTQNIYINCRPGAYYVVSNEPYLFVTLAMGNVPTLDTITVGSAQGVEQVGSKLVFPVMIKSFKGNVAQQALVVNSKKELGSFVKSIKGAVDAFLIREFVEDDVYSCVVIGEKAFGVIRKHKEQDVDPLEKGKSTTLGDHDKEIATKAARVCGLDIAQVNIVDGKVISVSPIIDWNVFSKVTSVDYEDQVAQFYFDKVKQFGEKRTFVDELKGIKDALSKTVFGRLIK